MAAIKSGAGRFRLRGKLTVICRCKCHNSSFHQNPQDEALILRHPTSDIRHLTSDI